MEVVDKSHRLKLEEVLVHTKKKKQSTAASLLMFLSLLRHLESFHLHSLKML